MKEEAQTLTALIRSVTASRRRVVNQAVKRVQVLGKSMIGRKISRRTYRMRCFKHKLRKLLSSKTNLRKTLRFPLTLK